MQIYSQIRPFIKDNVSKMSRKKKGGGREALQILNWKDIKLSAKGDERVSKPEIHT